MSGGGHTLLAERNHHNSLWLASGILSGVPILGLLLLERKRLNGNAVVCCFMAISRLKHAQSLVGLAADELTGITKVCRGDDLHGLGEPSDETSILICYVPGLEQNVPVDV